MSNRRQEQEPICSDDSDDDVDGLDDDLLRDDEQVKDLFSDQVFATVAEMLEHMKQEYAFDLRELISSLGADMYGSIKVINYLRRQYCNTIEDEESEHDVFTKDMVKVLDDLIRADNHEGGFSKDTWKLDGYLKPVLGDDPLLYAFEDSDSDSDSDGEEADVINSHVITSTPPQAPKVDTPVQNQTTSPSQNAVAAVQIMANSHDTLQQRVVELEMQLGLAKKQVQSLILADEDPNMKPIASSGRAAARNGNADSEAPDAYYFDSYGHLDIHQEMLSDVARTEAYRDAIVKNPKVFKDKVVIDVGCGTSILSLFAASTGAKHVFGIELSNMAHGARRVVAANGFTDKITVLQQRAETVMSLVPNQKDESLGKADVIVSEWMGYALLFESMLDSVLDVRNRLLKPGGRMFPNTADVFVEGMMSEKDRSPFWKDVYGYKMSCLTDTPLLPDAKPNDESRPDLDIPDVIAVSQSSICTDRATLHSIDMETVQAHELDFSRPFVLCIKETCTLSGLVLSFDTSFTASESTKQDWEHDVVLSTRVNATPTHWKQTVMWLKTPLKAEAGMVLKGQLTYRRNARNPRNIDLDLVVKSEDGKWALEQKYVMR